MTEEPPQRPRWSDGELLRLRLDFERYVARQEAYNKNQEQLWRQLADIVQSNSEATREQARALEDLAKSTEGVVKFFRDMESTVRVSGGIKGFLLWVVSVATASATIILGILHFINP
jgi:hypothetical protein